MKAAFNMDNPFFTLMGKLADYVILNLLFLLTACPVVTIGTALCAMHEVLPRMAEGTEGALYRTYMQSFIRNFWRTLPVWLFLLASGVVLVFDVTIAADALGAMQKVVLPAAGGLLVLWLLVFSWVFLPQEGGGSRVRERLCSALRAAVTHLPRSLVMAVVEVFPVFCYLFLTRFFLGIVLPFYVCAGFSLSAALCSLLAGKTRIVRFPSEVLPRGAGLACSESEEKS